MLRKFLPTDVTSTAGKFAEKFFHACMFGLCCCLELGGMLSQLIRKTTLAEQAGYGYARICARGVIIRALR